MNLDPASLSFIQSYFLGQISDHYQLVLGYATNLLYVFAVFELTLFGLTWALQQNPAWEKLFFRIFKVLLLFFIVTSSPYILQVIIESFARIGGTILPAKQLSDIIFNPALLWQYGYNPAVALLKAGASSGSFGLALLDLILGFSILLVFGLFVIQIVFQMIAFFIVSMASLIILPLGVFHPMADMFSQAVRSVLKAGIRVMVLVIITAAAINIWGLYKVSSLTATANLNQVLGLLFSGLLFLYFSWYLPKLAAEVVGKIHFRDPTSAGQATIVPASPPTVTPVMTTGGSGASSMGTSPMSLQAASALSGATTAGVGVASSVTAAPGVVSSSGGGVAGSAIQPTMVGATSSLQAKAGKIALSSQGASDRIGTDAPVSEKTIKDIKQALLKIMADQGKKERSQAADDNPYIGNSEDEDKDWRIPE